MSRPFRILSKLSILFLFSFLFLKTSHVKATHYKGGELTWRCVNSGPDKGKFIFTVTFYRICYLAAPSFGIPNPIKNPFGPDIPVTLISRTDISPPCSDPNNYADCNHPYNSRQRGAYEKFVYESMPVTLVGTPSVNGSLFYMFPNSNRRRTGNILSAGGLVLMAKMYPKYKNGVPQPIGQPGNPSCTHSSPVFAEPPQFVYRVGDDNYMNFKANAEDPSKIEYELVEPPILPNSSSSITYRPGFSFLSPLPDSSWNSLNQGANMDRESGILHYRTRNPLSGWTNYEIAASATAYKCGKPTAKIYRDFWMEILAQSWHNSYGAINNVAPLIEINGQNTFYDTVYIGDTVQFNVSVLDSQLVDTNRLQMIDLALFGSIFSGGKYNPTNSSCISNNCPSLDTNVSSWNGITWNDSIQLSTDFTWVTDCELLQADSCFGTSPKTFHFLFRSSDDLCRLPAVGYGSAFITVLPDTTSSAVKLDSLRMAAPNEVSVHWQPYTGLGFNHYYILRALGNSFDFDIIDSVSSPTATTYLDSTANSTSIYTYSVTLDTNDFSPCNGSDAYTNINLTVNNLTNGLIDLQWTNASLFVNSDTIYYQVNYIDTAGVVHTLDSIKGTYYQDTISNCEPQRVYQIKAYTGNQYRTFSNRDTISVKSPTNTTLTITNLRADTTGGVTITWQALPPPTTLSAYKLYIYQTTDTSAGYVILDSVINPIVTTYYHSVAGADTIANYYYVQLKAYSECKQDTILSEKSNTVKTGKLFIRKSRSGYVYMFWSPFVSINNKSGQHIYKIYKQFGANPNYVLIDSTTFGNEEYMDTISICGSPLNYTIVADSAGTQVIFSGSIQIAGYDSTLINQGDSLLIAPQGISYQWFRNDSLFVHNDHLFTPDSSGTYHVIVTLDNGCLVNSDSVEVEIKPPPPPNPSGIADYEDHRNISIQPNPANGSFQLSINLSQGEQALLELITITGKTARQHEFAIPNSGGRQREEVNIDTLPNGLYLLKIVVGNQVFTEKLIVQ